MRAVIQLLLVYYVLCTIPLYSQNSNLSQTNKIEFYTPEAASLARKIEYPVSPINGNPDIRIPLYKVQARTTPLEFGLTFSQDEYFRVNTLPGSVGAGWTLDIDFQISRVINGFDDFSNLPEKKGYYYSSLVEANYYMDKPFNRSLNPGSANSRSEFRQMYQGKYDNEPDRFYFKIPGKSGKFYFQKQIDASMKAVCVPYQAVKITYTDGNFTLTDTNGTIYTFIACDKSGISGATLSDYSIISWKCATITNATGIREATFAYGTEYTYNDIYVLNDRAEIYDDFDNCDAQQCQLASVANFWDIMGPKMLKFGGVKEESCFFNEGQSFEHYNNDADRPSSYSKVNQIIKLISEISFSDGGGKIVFHYIDNHILDSIQFNTISNGTYSPYKTIHFYQPTTEVGSTNKSLRYMRTLDSIKVGDEKYKLKYGRQHEGNLVSDFWGYKGFQYSGSGTGAAVNLPKQDVEIKTCAYYPNYIPNHGCVVVPSNLRTNTVSPWSEDVSALDTSLITLLTIVYPTGGRTEFAFGQHRYFDNLNNKKGAGGYRIEKISFFDTETSTSSIREKLYNYIDGFIRREPLLSGDQNNTYTLRTAEFYPQGGGNYPIATARLRTFYPTAIASLSFENGASVNYNTVEEYEKGKTTMAGKTVYKTDLEYYSPTYTSPTDPFPFETEEWDRGLMDEIIQYKYVNGIYEWVQKKKFLYDIQDEPIQIFREKVSLYNEMFFPYGAPTQNNYNSFFDQHAQINHSYGGIRTGYIQNKGFEFYERDELGNVFKQVTTNYYDSPKDLLPTRTEIKNFDGSTSIIHSIYPYNYSNPTSFVQYMIAKNMLQFPIEAVERRNGIIHSGVINTYNSNGTLNQILELKSQIRDSSLFKLSNKNINDYSLITPKFDYLASDCYEATKTYYKYDCYNNPVCILDNKTGQYTTYLSSYRGLYQIAEIVNAHYTTVIDALHSSWDTYTEDKFINEVPKETDPGDIRSGLDNYFYSSNYTGSKPVLINTYYYYPFIGLKWKTDIRGLQTKFSYDTDGRLKEVYYEKNGTKQVVKAYDYNFKK